MATLKDTLGSVRPPGKAIGYQSFGVYPTFRATDPGNFGSRVNFGSQFENPNMFSALAQSPQTKEIPNAGYSPSFDYDPVLSKIQNLGTQDVQSAESDATNLKRQTLIQAGSPDFVRDVGGDENTATAAANNPFSTLALLRKDKEAKHKSLVEALNDQNLYYSGEHQRLAGLDEQSYAQTQADFLARLRQMLADIQSGVLNAKLHAYTPPQVQPPPIVQPAPSPPVVTPPSLPPVILPQPHGNGTPPFKPHVPDPATAYAGNVGVPDDIANGAYDVPQLNYPHIQEALAVANQGPAEIAANYDTPQVNYQNVEQLDPGPQWVPQAAVDYSPEPAYTPPSAYTPPESPYTAPPPAATGFTGGFVPPAAVNYTDPNLLLALARRASGRGPQG